MGILTQDLFQKFETREKYAAVYNGENFEGLKLVTVNVTCQQLVQFFLRKIIVGHHAHSQSVEVISNYFNLKLLCIQRVSPEIFHSNFRTAFSCQSIK